MPTDHRAALADIKTFPQLIAYLRDEMGWPIARDSFEDVDDLFYDFTADELGIDPKTAAKITQIKRLKPLSTRQPWGIFFVKFEPKKLPVVALRRILSQVALKKRASANSADRIVWAADDLLFVSNYGEGDERQISFAHFSRAKDGHDLPTLKVLGWDNLDTALRLDSVARELSEHLAWPNDEDDAEAWRMRWRAAFTLGHRGVVTKSKELSIRLAELARNIRDRIKTALAIETDKGPLTRLMKAFQEALVHDLDADGFADMYAQTIAYGLLSARITDPHKKTADDFAAHMRTNPFLRELMETFFKVGGRRGKAGGPGIDFDELGVSEVVEMLDDANMEAVVRDFGDRNPQEDPVIHFYELFLKEYDAKKRMQRGVFYTPRPVVSYIVRSVDELLRNEFGLADGLADTATWGEMAKRHKDLIIPKGVSSNQDFVQILDPAAGTGTFLVEVIDLIHKTLFVKWKAEGHGDRKIDVLWNEYVPKHLLTRLHGYELLMAPYTIAHLKIGLKLHETGYRFGTDERVQVFLTNALEPWVRQPALVGFDALAHEASAVNAVKYERRFTAVVGNPPYSNFGQQNKNEYILSLLDDYKKGLNEKKLNLDDDFIKFFRFGHEQCIRAGVGIMGLITNHTFASGLTHRQMRRSLMDSFTLTYVMDLHGSQIIPETPPVGFLNENVFDIKQGVAITLAAKLPGNELSRVLHIDLWGKRSEKYLRLMKESVTDGAWKTLTPQAPNYFFDCRTASLVPEYADYWSLRDIMPVGSSGIQTKRDALFVDTDKGVLTKRMRDVLSNGATSEMRKRYSLEASTGWSPGALETSSFSIGKIRPYLHRPFDKRWIYYDPELLGRARFKVFQHLLHPNVAIVTMRQTVDNEFHHVFCTDGLCDINLLINHHVSDQVFPLYLYQENIDLVDRADSRRPNIAAPFVSAICGATGLKWLPDSRGDLAKTFGPDNVLSYIYAVLHSPEYRRRYWEEIRSAFPRIPVTRTRNLFCSLSQLGCELLGLHLKPSIQPTKAKWVGRIPSAPVGKARYRDEHIWLDDAQSSGVSKVDARIWQYRVGGYEVCSKWLSERKGSNLAKEDIQTFFCIMGAIEYSIRTADNIDVVVAKSGGWPDAFC